jgi:hypothetical protein
MTIERVEYFDISVKEITRRYWPGYFNYLYRY